MRNAVPRAFARTSCGGAAGSVHQHRTRGNDSMHRDTAVLVAEYLLGSCNAKQAKREFKALRWTSQSAKRSGCHRGFYADKSSPQHPVPPLAERLQCARAMTEFWSFFPNAIASVDSVSVLPPYGFDRASSFQTFQWCTQLYKTKDGTRCGFDGSLVCPALHPPKFPLATWSPSALFPSSATWFVNDTQLIGTISALFPLLRFDVRESASLVLFYWFYCMVMCSKRYSCAAKGSTPLGRRLPGSGCVRAIRRRSFGGTRRPHRSPTRTPTPPRVLFWHSSTCRPQTRHWRQPEQGG